MKFNRIGRILVCLVLICALVINISPIKAKAVVGELVAGAISTAPVWVPVATAAASILIALGVMASADRTSFNTTVNDVVTYLETSTTYVVNGMVAVWGVFGADQVTRSFVLKDMIQDVWCWLFDSGTVAPQVASLTSGSVYALYDLHTYTLNGPGFVFKFNYIDADNYNYHRYFHVVVCDGTMKRDDGVSVSKSLSLNGNRYYFVYVDASTQTMFDKYPGIKSGSVNFGTLNLGSSTLNLEHALSSLLTGYFSGEYSDYYTLDGLVLGQIQAPPESKQLEDTEVYTDYITKIEFCPDGRPDYGEDKKEHLPIAFPNTDLDDLIIGQTQEDAQSGDNDLDFDFETSTDTSGDGTDTDPDSGLITYYPDTRPFLVKILDKLSEFLNFPQLIADAMKVVLQELFVPDPEFIPNKVEALKAEYKFLDPMLSTGEDLKLFFQNIGSQPPIIWIDLGAGTGWYPMGGKVKFVDLTWYSQYKPTVDPIVGGFIWLWLAWRLFKAVPGLIAGDSGTVGAPTVAPDISFNPSRLPAGRSRRKKDGE